MLRSRPFQPLRRAVTYGAVRFCLWSFNLIPRSWGRGVARVLCTLITPFLTSERRRFADVMGELAPQGSSAQEREKLASRYFQLQACNLVDVIRFRRHFHSEIHRLVDIEGEQNWREACAQGRGAVFVSGHLGNHELLGACMANLGTPVAVIAREMYDGRLNRLLRQTREAVGMELIQTTDSPKRIVEWLRRGNGLGVLIDTESHRVRSMPIPCFGHLSNTPVGASIIALRLGAAVCPAACVRLPNHRYRLIIKPPLVHPDSGDRERDAYLLTLECTRALEQFILAYPDQWIWFHDRWRANRCPNTGRAQAAS